MKNILILIILSLGTLTFYGQEEIFKFDEIVYGDKKEQSIKIPGSYVVLKIDGSINELYDKTRSWINETYSDPEESIISDTEDKFLKIQGTSATLFYINIFGADAYYPGKYRLSFKFKENKIKVELTSFEIEKPGGWMDYNFINLTKKNGKPDKNGTKRVQNITDYFNELIISLKYHKSTNIDQNDDW